MSSTAGAVISAFITSPLDVLKVRMQNNYCFSGRNHVRPDRFHGAYPFESVKFSCDCAALKMSVLKGARYIYRHDGLMTLYNGAMKSTSMAGASALIYWPLYEFFKQELSKYTKSKVFLPLGAALSGRSITTMVLFPMEFLRTVEQGQRSFTRLKFSSLLRTPPSGFNVTLARDLLFSCVYWLTVENFRGASNQLASKMYKNSGEGGMKPSKGRDLGINILAGGIGGALASLMTLPIDVVKTRKQLHPERFSKWSMLKLMNKIRNDEGLGVLWSGVRPRVTKAVIFCAMTLGLYEMIYDTIRTDRHNN